MSTVTPIIDHVKDLWPSAGAPDDALGQLVLASHLLGANRAVSNFGGGNTSAKGTTVGHTGREINAMWVKGSGSSSSPRTCSAPTAPCRTSAVATPPPRASPRTTRVATSTSCG